MSNNLLDQTINRTTNSDCPHCKAKTQHTPKAWKKYHPLAGTGIQADIRPINKAASKVKDS